MALTLNWVAGGDGDGVTGGSRLEGLKSNAAETPVVAPPSGRDGCGGGRGRDEASGLRVKTVRTVSDEDTGSFPGGWVRSERGP